MSLSVRYRYVKRVPSPKRKRVIKLCSLALVGGGATLLLSVVFPIVSWQLFYAPYLSSTTLFPIPKVVVASQYGDQILSTNTKSSAIGFDSIHANTWFPTGNPKSSIIKDYMLSIPKLGIHNAKVSIGTDDLSKSLVHYGGSSLPGEYGNAVIFGHSVLPQFFDPKNYKTIFSTLHTLKKGDVIEIVSDGIAYTYRVFDMRVVNPDEISVLEQIYNNSYLTVITCAPPGTYWKRLVVKARIDKA